MLMTGEFAQNCHVTCDVTLFIRLTYKINAYFQHAKLITDRGTGFTKVAVKFGSSLWRLLVSRITGSLFLRPCAASYILCNNVAPSKPSNKLHASASPSSD